MNTMPQQGYLGLPFFQGGEENANILEKTEFIGTKKRIEKSGQK